MPKVKERKVREKKAKETKLKVQSELQQEITKAMTVTGKRGFKPFYGEQPLSDKMLGVRLQKDIMEKLEDRKGGDKVRWAREVLTKAIEELE